MQSGPPARWEELLRGAPRQGGRDFETLLFVGGLESGEHHPA